eukprot:3658606-Rhodomonas_salina.1
MSSRSSSWYTVDHKSVPASMPLAHRVPSSEYQQVCPWYTVLPRQCQQVPARPLLQEWLVGIALPQGHFQPDHVSTSKQRR